MRAATSTKAAITAAVVNALTADAAVATNAAAVGGGTFDHLHSPEAPLLQPPPCGRYVASTGPWRAHFGCS